MSVVTKDLTYGLKVFVLSDSPDYSSDLVTGHDVHVVYKNDGVITSRMKGSHFQS